MTGVARGQYSDSVLDELESQNDDEVQGMSSRVKMLKEVRIPAERSPLLGRHDLTTLSSSSPWPLETRSETPRSSQTR